MKQIILMRHAEARPTVTAPSDRERILTMRGWQELESIKSLLQKRLQVVDRVICSNASRTRQTYDGIKNLISASAQVSFEDSLYQGSANRISDFIMSINNKNKAVLIICHNPGISDFLNLVNHRDVKTVPSSFPTSGVAFLEHQSDFWGDMIVQNLTLKEFIEPVL